MELEAGRSWKDFKGLIFGYNRGKIKTKEREKYNDIVRPIYFFSNMPIEQIRDCDDRMNEWMNE